jgi:hypothetical protein
MTARAGARSKWERLPNYERQIEARERIEERTRRK